MEELIKEIKDYIPYNEQEVKDKEYFLKWIDTFDDVLTRDNGFAHFSASSFVLNKDKTKILVVYHKIYDGWTSPGGHADGESDLCAVAIREVEEETGLQPKLLHQGIYAIHSLPIMSHIKNNKFVPAHIHLDVVYLLEADDTKPLKYRPDESKGVKWINIEEALSEKIVHFSLPTHKKIIEKLNIKDN